ncbi:hypothetical protein [Treponema zioleckii]|uniref:hypothetical protein n=1 Tax=Treponema zioleckii TaxID=331680 RepID=UPI00168BC374|nr:hypothetical protein [Treponema zioleckii]
MKLFSKRFLAVTSSIALLAGAFIGCSSDDEEDAFSGDTVEFDNGRVFIKTDEDGSTKTKTSDFILTNITDIKQATSETATKSGYYNVTNDSYYYRAFKQTTTKHYDSTCTFTITPNDLNSTNVSNGVLGFVFGLTSENVTASDNTTTGTAYSFGVAAVRWNASANKAQYYVAWEDGAVVKANNYQTSGNFMDINGTELEDSTTGEKYFSGWQDLGVTSLTDGKLVIKAKVTANDDGSYKVVFYDSNDAVLETNEGVTASITGFNAKTQAKLARYVNIYFGENFNATAKFSDTNGADIIFEDDVVEE